METEKELNYELDQIDERIDRLQKKIYELQEQIEASHDLVSFAITDHIRNYHL
jgi:predicted  nucleic acid-binding Zn-ribbon protein